LCYILTVTTIGAVCGKRSSFPEKSPHQEKNLKCLITAATLLKQEISRNLLLLAGLGLKFDVQIMELACQGQPQKKVKDMQGPRRYPD
jgi:hypothetical protein